MAHCADDNLWKFGSLISYKLKLGSAVILAVFYLLNLRCESEIVTYSEENLRHVGYSIDP